MWPMRLARNASSHFSYDAMSVRGNRGTRLPRFMWGAPNYPEADGALEVTVEFAGAFARRSLAGALGGLNHHPFKDAMLWESSRKSLFLGLMAGLVFGSADLVVTWLNPIEDDSPLVLLRFYGPMFLLWGVVSFKATRSTGRFLSGVAAGVIVAFATFAVFVVINFVRVNLFLDELTSRADWQSMMMRFRAAGAGDLRLFVNFDYLRGTPLKIATATGFGTALGVVGGTLGWLTRRWANPRTA